MKKVTTAPSPRRPSRKKMARRYSPCTSFILRRKLSMPPAPGRRMRRSRRSRNWTSFSSPWARARDDHEVVDLAVGDVKKRRLVDARIKVYFCVVFSDNKD